MSENEDYLDQLLNQFTQGSTTKKSNKANQESEEMNLDDGKKDENDGTDNDDDDFIRQFENEMDEFNADTLISEFELELDQELVMADEDEGNIDHRFFSGLNEVMGRPDDKSQSVPTSLEDETVEELPKAEEVLQDDLEIEEDKLEEASEEIQEEIPEEAKEEVQEDGLPLKKPVDLDSDEDILDLLSGLVAEDEELSDIANMLKADENHEKIEDDENLNLDEELKIIAEDKLDDESHIEGQKSKKEKKKKVKGIFNKFSKTLFEEAEAKEEEMEVVPLTILDGTETAEELAIMETLNNADIVIKTQEEQEKEDKKNAALEIKAQKEKAKQEAKLEAKKEKDAKKAELTAKKKEKLAQKKVVDKTPSLPRKPVFLIFLLAFSILILVILATNGSGYQLAKKQANNLYIEGNYVEAYAVIAGVELKEVDADIYDKVVLLAGMQEQYRAYNVFFQTKRYEQALDALVRGIAGYYDGKEAAAKLDVANEFEVQYKQLQDAIVNNYKMTDEQVLALHQIQKRNLYSVELIQIVKKLTFN